MPQPCLKIEWTSVCSSLATSKTENGAKAPQYNSLRASSSTEHVFGLISVHEKNTTVHKRISDKDKLHERLLNINGINHYFPNFFGRGSPFGFDK